MSRNVPPYFSKMGGRVKVVEPKSVCVGGGDPVVTEGLAILCTPLGGIFDSFFKNKFWNIGNWPEIFDQTSTIVFKTSKNDIS